MKTIYIYKIIFLSLFLIVCVFFTISTTIPSKTPPEINPWFEITKGLTISAGVGLLCCCFFIIFKVLASYIIGIIKKEQNLTRPEPAALMLVFLAIGVIITIISLFSYSSLIGAEGDLFSIFVKNWKTYKSLN